MAVQAAIERLFKGDCFLFNPGEERVHMTVLAVGLRLFQVRRVVLFYPVNTLVIHVYYFFMGKVFLCKGGLDVAFIRTIYHFLYRVVGKLGDRGVAVPAGNVLMDTLGIEDITYIPSSSILPSCRYLWHMRQFSLSAAWAEGRAERENIISNVNM
jgi:hypothetical protein